LYVDTPPIETPVRANRQGAKRHYGVHPYFTRRPYNVVRQYILHYSRERDYVLDPFGGSGVTAVEAFLENRIGIQNDINPLANFIAKGVAGLSTGNLDDYKQALNLIRERCKPVLDRIATAPRADITEIQRHHKLPPNIDLPSNSDVHRYHDLFSTGQLTSLAVLKDAIDEVENKPARQGMLLAWSATLAKLNRTFLSAEGRAESRGGSSIFSIYRYKVAKNPVELPAWQTFEERALNVVSAKVEIDKQIEMKRRTTGWLGRFQAHSYDISDLTQHYSAKIDYIFTDPPYGGHISYLDLSTLWNCWLGMMPKRSVREAELIVGGDLNLSEQTYISRLRQSVEACLRMLKRQRWLSIVFQHWNVAYFEAILASAADSGAELRAAVSQVGDPIWSMHKKKGSESVLAGELILTFMKTGRPNKLRPLNGFDVEQAVTEALSSTPEDKMYGEHLFNKIVIAAWRNGAIGLLNISKTEFIDLIQRNGWQYDEKNHFWVRHRQPETLFTSAV